MAMDSSSTNSDWKSEDEGFDLNNSHDNHNVHPITSTTDNPTDRLQDMHDVAFLDRVQQIRNDRWEHSRLNWNAHVVQLQHEGSFENEYLMSLRSHGRLVRILDPLLQRKEYNSRGPEPILVEHIVGNGLRIVSGGRPKCQRMIFGMCKDASYKAFIDFVNAVNTAPELAIEMPSTPEEWNTIYNNYKKKSTNEIMAGCVACIDGFFQSCNRPTRKEVANVISYFSGHYESYGLNCQACVKPDLQFMYFGVVSPGSTNDNISYTQADKLKAALSSLPHGLFALGDAAYTLSEKFLIPFTGADRLDPAQYAFNYYLSQLCIRVEMGFSRLVKKLEFSVGK